MKRKNYSVEFKVKAFEMFKTSGRSEETLAKKLLIACSTMSKWIRHHESSAFNSSGPKTQLQISSDKELLSLTTEPQRKNIELEMPMAFIAREIL